MAILTNISPEVRTIVHLLRRVFKHPAHHSIADLPEWDNQVNWNEVLKIIQTQGVLPLVHRSLKTLENSDIPDPFIQDVRKAFLRNGLLIQMQKDALRHVWNSFKPTSIPVLFFKGPVLGKNAYGNPIWRKPGDIDVLIHPANYAKARQVLIDVGYQVDKAPGIEKKLLLSGSEMVFSRNGFEVDLHWSLEQTALNRFPFSPGFDAEEIWERSTFCHVDDQLIPSLSPEDSLFLLCAHGGKHAWAYLYMICDIAMMISNQEDFDWDRVLGLAEKLNTERITYLGLYLARSVFGVELPQSVDKAIERYPNMRTLSRKVMAYIFRPTTSLSAFQYHRVRVGLLNRSHEKALYGFYLFNNKARKISHSLIGS